MLGLSQERTKGQRIVMTRSPWKRVYRWQYVPQHIKQVRFRNLALMRRLREGVRLARAGYGTDTTGMSDTEFLEHLRR